MDVLTVKEQALIKFKALAEKYSQKRFKIHEANEATTRLLIIDEILKIIGWTTDDFNPESHSSTSGYADYLLKDSKVPRLVVEAKRIGSTFASPTQKNIKSHEYTIAYFKSAFKNLLTDTIKQASMYCYDNGVSFAVITNGAEWMVLQLIPKPGKNIDNMKGVYFGNMFSDDFYFDHFWALLAKDNVIAGNLENYLGEINYAPSPVAKILKSDYGSLRWGSYSKDEYIDEFYEAFFDEITKSNQLKMLEYCFVTDSKLDQYRGDLKRVLKDSAPKFLPQDTCDMDPGESKDSIVSESNSGKVILITGSVGCGKTTLVRKALNETKRDKKGTTIPILVDLINDVSKSETQAKKVIYKRINENILSHFEELLHLPSLRKTYKKEINALKNGPYKEVFDASPEIFCRHEAELLEKLKSDTEDFVLKSLKCVTEQGINVILIIDNADRASEYFQEEMYTIAYTISEMAGATVIITMREFTFFKNKDKGFLDVRSGDKVIHLKAPDFSKLVAKRIRYIENHFDDDFRTKDWRQRYDLKKFKELSYQYASVIKNSIQLTNDGPKILETLSCVSWHNIRLFYDLLKRVHTQLGSKSGRWEHEGVIAALMVGPQEGQSIVLPNIFVPFQNVNQCYFLKLRVLIFLSASVKANERTHGVPLQRLLSFAQMYGYRSAWITATIEECVRQRLVECLEIPSDGDDVVDFCIRHGETFRISPLGAIFVEELVKNKIYLSLISTDLPFHNEEDFSNIRKEYAYVLSYMGDNENNIILKDGIDLISESRLSTILGKYLFGKYESEKTVSKSLESLAEISLTEDKLKLLVRHLFLQDKPIKRTAYNSKQITLDLLDPNEENNLSVSENDDAEDDFEIVQELVPQNIDGLKFNRTEFIPLVLCALVIRKFQGKEYSLGTEITEIINKYIVSDDNRKETTNVSRALRTNSLKNQKWLVIRTDLHPKYGKFGLDDCWKNHWQQIFGEFPNF